MSDINDSVKSNSSSPLQPDDCGTPEEQEQDVSVLNLIDASKNVTFFEHFLRTHFVTRETLFEVLQHGEINGNLSCINACVEHKSMDVETIKELAPEVFPQDALVTAVRGGDTALTHELCQYLRKFGPNTHEVNLLAISNVLDGALWEAVRIMNVHFVQLLLGFGAHNLRQREWDGMTWENVQEYAAYIGNAWTLYWIFGAHEIQIDEHKLMTAAISGYMARYLKQGEQATTEIFPFLLDRKTYFTSQHLEDAIKVGCYKLVVTMLSNGQDWNIHDLPLDLAYDLREKHTNSTKIYECIRDVQDIRSGILEMEQIRR